MSETNIPEDQRLSRPESGQEPQDVPEAVSLLDVMARGAGTHRMLTVVVLFLGMLLVAGTVVVFGTIIYRLGETVDESAPTIEEQRN